jgi:hypothetical protein
MASAFPAFADNPAPAGDAQVVSSILTRYAGLAKKRGWMSAIDGGSLRAVRFNADYDEILVRVTSAKKDRLTVFTADFTKNSRTQSRQFSFDGSRPDFTANATTAVTAHLLSLTLEEDDASRGRSPYFGWFAAGYHRVRDTHEIFPDKNEGGYYLAMSIAYDPSRLTERPVMPLRFGDYMTIDMWAVADSDPERRNYVDENFFNIDLMFYGTHRFNRSGQSTSRFVYGFYTGMEYFRPGWKDNVLLWSHQLYREQPHIQYMIWRAVGWGFTGQWTGPWGSYSASFMAGLGPSINSSLFAIEWDEQEELDRSPLFQSLTGSKQNYYYSTAFPVSAVITAERIWRLRLSIGYNFCFFYASDPAIKGERAWDTLQIIKPSAGIYLLDNLMLNFNYERWYIDSTLNGDHTSHVWNRLVAELRYIVQ